MGTPRSGDISLFAVIKIDRDRRVSDLDRFVALALPSFRRFLTDGVVSEIVVVVPTSDLGEVRRRLAREPGIPLRVVDEADVVTDADATVGWIKQQILKLGAPAVISTPWFITIDADVLATRPVDHDFLLPEGRAIWQQEVAGAHLDWWRGSAELLRAERMPDAADAVFGVTPAIMHTDSLRGLHARIETEHPGSSWSATLAERHDAGWTEYSLYWTYLLDRGTADRLYATTRQRPYALGGSIWTAEDLATRSDAIAEQFAPDAEHAFFVFQSNLEIPLSAVVRMVRPHISGTDRITLRERLRWALHDLARRVRGKVGAVGRRLSASRAR